MVLVHHNPNEGLVMIFFNGFANYQGSIILIKYYEPGIKLQGEKIASFTHSELTGNFIHVKNTVYRQK